MSLFASAHPNRRVRRLAGILTASVAVFALAACSAPAEGDASDDTRVYESAFGDVELPETIERIVSVDFYTPAALIDLGIMPVGVVNTYFTDTEGLAIPVQYSSAIADADVESIGEYYELNLEAVAKADPDVIIATSDFLPLDDPLREELEKVAPIITFDARDGESWRTRATELAKILDREDVLQPLVEKYDARRDEIKEQYAGILSDQAVTVFVPFADEWATYADTHFSTPILRDLGATFREQADDEINEAKFPNWFSYENLDRLANADVILLNNHDEETLAMLDANTIWQNLPAVQGGMVFDYIPLSPTGSFGWASENLEDLDALLAQVQTKVDAQG
ncbi:ABC transporter substrate-binding protein [Microbacterium sp. MYb62]|uniref:ABC transporter substrate-binding protein n=1 Tax=Microbacterium sp. MYb62 TaxID=1848690 RepID=UPI000CFDEF8B|nr:ABC transporter substrate-binding protein [Microbacterium sp. MYb62]PRB14210.1 Fe3+-hydroxamate ABC transporter substrate-binding protein [Microbacterium sp. MYb62]